MNVYLTIIANASTLVLLTKAGLIDNLLEVANLLIPQKVYEEAVVSGKKKGAEDAYKIEKLVQETRIQIKDVPKNEIDQIQSLFNLKSGERDTIALAQSIDVQNVLTDDKKAINACRALDLKFTTAIDILVQLEIQGIIDLDKAKEALDRLEKFGWYDKSLIQKARGDLGES